MASSNIPESRDLSAEWDFTKNLPALYEDVAKGSNKKFWWKCARNHEWQATPNSRFHRKKTDCPFCSNQRVLVGFNDLASKYPAVAEEWDHDANDGLTPSSVAFASGKKVHWKCNKGHLWSAPVFKRTQSGSKCPACSNRKVLAGFNDLASQFPDIAAEWDYDLNVNASPETIYSNSNARVYWKCAKGHQWKTSVYHRTQGGTKCPVCTNRQILPGENDLGTIFPDLKRQWDETRNLPRTISEFSSNSGYKAWWLCEKGHSYKQTIGAKTKGLGCPVCSNYLVIPGQNDLARTHPELALEWHPTKNGDLLPEDVVSGSHKGVWWLCSSGHDWKAQPVNRASGNGCPSCATYGFKLDKAGFLYFIQNDELMARKVGITNIETDRLKRFGQRGWQINKLWEFEEGRIAIEVEGLFFKWLRHEMNMHSNLTEEHTKGTGGWTEAFSVDDIDNDTVIAKIESLIASLKTH